MNEITWIIIYFLIFMLCCGLLGFMGSKRKIGTRRSLLIPFAAGVALAAILLLVYRSGSFAPGSLFSEIRNVFLLPFLAALAAGYFMVKFSPASVSGADKLEDIYERAIQYELKGENEKAIRVYQEAMRQLVHEKTHADRNDSAEWDNLIRKLESKISSLREK